MLNPQEGGRLDAKRHYVILAKALDGIWPVGHACAVLRVEHPFSQKIDMSSTSAYVGEKRFQEFGPIFFDMFSAIGYIWAKSVQESDLRIWVKHIFRNLVLDFGLLD